MNVVRIIPPLVTTADEVDLALRDDRREPGGRRCLTNAAADRLETFLARLDRLGLEDLRLLALPLRTRPNVLRC